MNWAMHFNMDKLSGPGIITVAAKHNLRDFSTDARTPPNIDGLRTHLNVVLRGPCRALDVTALANNLLTNANVGTLRKDAVLAVEILVSLPVEAMPMCMEYFVAVVQWAESYFAVPVISAVVHLDEAAPHCHILLLPLLNGRMQGSDLVGGRAKLRASKLDLYENVGKRFGLKRPATPARISRSEKRTVMDSITKALSRMGVTDDAVMVALLEPHARNPAPLAHALGIQPVAKAVKSFVSIMTAPCRPTPKQQAALVNPIGFEQTGERLQNQTLSCVGFTSSDDNFGSAKPVSRHDDDLVQPVQIQVEVDAHDAIEDSAGERTVVRESDIPAGWWDEVTGTFQAPTVQPRKKAAVQAAVDDALNRINHRNSEVGEHHNPPST